MIALLVFALHRLRRRQRPQVEQAQPVVEAATVANAEPVLDLRSTEFLWTCALLERTRVEGELRIAFQEIDSLLPGPDAIPWRTRAPATRLEN